MLENLRKNKDLAIQLQRVEEIMIKHVGSRHLNVQHMLTNMIKSGGKMLRPAFFLLSSQYGNEEAEQRYEIAAAIEMIHMATLIHDDIIDEADLRRGLETPQFKYGKDYAVFMGDFLLNRGIQLAGSGACLQEVLRTMEKIFYGEMLQYNNRFCRNAGVARYIRIAANKTASLFSLSCFLGGRSAGCEPNVSCSLKKAGLYFGIAFQIVDDILDFLSDQDKIGKNVQNDLKMGFYTLPVIYASKENDGQLWRVMDTCDSNQLIRYIEEAGGIRKASELALKYIRKAETIFDRLPHTEAKETILDILGEMKHLLLALKSKGQLAC